MSSNGRQDQIFALLEMYEKMSVPDLAEHFHVTETTIRRDLIAMEEKNQIVRKRGLALLPERGFSMSLQRRNTFQEEKQRIAEKALSMIGYGMSLALDTGTTVEALVHLMKGKCQDYKPNIVTSSLKVAYECCTAFPTSMPGGFISADELSVAGLDAVNFFKSVTTDIAFIGSTGIYNSKGLTVSYPLIRDVKCALMGCADKKVALVDSSKYHTRGIYTFCQFDELDTLITIRTEENARILDEIARQGVEIILA